MELMQQSMALAFLLPCFLACYFDDPTCGGSGSGEIYGQNSVNHQTSSLSNFENLDPGRCGVQEASPLLSFVRKIINGKQAIRYSWPWQVLLKVDDHPACGGTIVRSNVVITAAHCVVKDDGSEMLSRVQVVAGLHNQDEQWRASVIGVAKIIPYPMYSFPGVNHDIALLILNHDLKFNSKIQPLCLPNRREEPVSGEYCVVTGWGATDANLDSESDTNSMVLQQAEVLVRSDAYCQFLFRVFSSSTINPPSNLCAGGNGKDTCQGDSGGPMQCKRSPNGPWYLAGVTAWGEGCGGITPGVYTQVEYYLNWINSNLRSAQS